MTRPFIAQTFNIPELKGISRKTIEEHLKLYAGYVKHTNLILEKIDDLSKDPEKNSYILSETQRRFGFEFGGMRNHEYYFRALEGGGKALFAKSDLRKAIAKEWGDYEVWVNKFKALAMTRGIGWAILYYDSFSERLVQTWVDEQHMGHLPGLSFIFGIDMFEHAYMIDYVPGEKKKYIDAYWNSVNFENIEKNFKKATSLIKI